MSSARTACSVAVSLCCDPPESVSQNATHTHRAQKGSSRNIVDGLCGGGCYIVVGLVVRLVSKRRPEKRAYDDDDAANARLHTHTTGLITHINSIMPPEFSHTISSNVEWGKCHGTLNGWLADWLARVAVVWLFAAGLGLWHFVSYSLLHLIWQHTVRYIHMTTTTTTTTNYSTRSARTRMQ